MKVTAEDLKQHYQSLSDEELLSLTRDALSEAARHCYDQELARRQLTPEPAEEEEAEEEGVEPIEDPRLLETPVIIAVFSYHDEIKLAQSVLQSAEIPSEARGLQVLVPESFAEQAKELLLPQMADTNRAVVRAWIDQVWNEGREAENDDCDTGATLAGLRAKLSGLQVEVEDIIAEGDKVAARLSLSGTGNGSPETHTGMIFVRVDTGRIVEAWYNLDIV